MDIVVVVLVFIVIVIVVVVVLFTSEGIRADLRCGTRRPGLAVGRSGTGGSPTRRG